MADTLSFTDEKYSTLASSQPNIMVTIPGSQVKDFLGVMALDILHDAKGYGRLAGGKLVQLTDLLAYSAIINDSPSQQDTEKIRNYFFTQVLEYFVELWTDNLSALGLDYHPDITDQNIDKYKSIVKLPIRNVANRSDDDTFIRLGKGLYGIESYNYTHQKNKLPPTTKNIQFISPMGVNNPSDYFNRAINVVNFVRQNTECKAKVSLDMKASAGLIRTITDPIGYATGLPTYADPGYNMPGMSAIRRNSAMAFDNKESAQEFRYIIKLAGAPTKKPLTFLDITYHYGIAKTGLDRYNLIVNVVGNTFKSTLPRSEAMSEALGRYLRPATREITETVADTLGMLEYVIWNFYHEICPNDETLEVINKQYQILGRGQTPDFVEFSKLLGSTAKINRAVYNWTQQGCSRYRTSYILSTIENLHYYNIEKYLPNVNYYLPEYMITKLLPELMYKYKVEEIWDINIIAFCYHQQKLLVQYVNNNDSTEPQRQEELKTMLNSQWLPKRKGKLLLQIDKEVKAWRNDQMLTILDHKTELANYLSQVLATCKDNLGILVSLDALEDDADDRLEKFLGDIPVFKPTKEVTRTLMNHLKFYRPEMFHRCTGMVYVGLLLATFLDTILWKKPLVTLDLNLQQSLTTTVTPTVAETCHIQNVQESLGKVIGKFSGDFGQIMWCMCGGHLFASEDSNASAMSLLMQRIPTLNVRLQKGTQRSWGNIYGKGDGSTVDVNIKKV